MAPLKRLLSHVIHSMAGAFYEGPEPPERISLEARRFAEVRPHATRREWIEFSASLAADYYRQGWTRGSEATERWPEGRPEPERSLVEVTPDGLEAFGEPVSEGELDSQGRLEVEAEKARTAYWEDRTGQGPRP